MATKTSYKAILFAPDGECVTDFYERETIEEVWKEVNDMGSRWVFYPIVFVATNRGPKKMTTIASCPEGLEYFKFRKCTTLQKFLQKQWATRKDDICEMINNGMPWDMVYPDKRVQWEND